MIEKALEAVAQQQPQRRRSSSIAPASKSHNNAAEMTQVSPKGTDEEFPAPKRLQWRIDDHILKAIEIATIKMDRWVDNCLDT